MPLFTAKLSHARFLQDYWRQKPCLFRGACNHTLPALLECTSEKQLLKLAGQDLVESRLVTAPHYQLRLGPFQFNAIPEDSLLMIQGLEQHWEEVSQMLTEDFSFLPRWKIDDVMATMGEAGATCGPHFDHYDVFLVQVCGQKGWKLDDGSHVDSDLEATSQLRLLTEFNAVDSKDVEPGDVLYIPPGVGHWGIAKGMSVTLSVGIRNPTLPELVSHLADRVVDRTDQTSTLDDSMQSPDDGIIDADIENLRYRLSGSLLNPKLIAQWYGAYLTEPREPELITTAEEISEEETAVLLSSSQVLACTLPSRLAYHENTNVITVFVNGKLVESRMDVKPWLTTLCNQRLIAGKDIAQDEASIRLVQYLLAAGAVVIKEKRQ